MNTNTNPKNSQNRQKKEGLVAELTEKVDKSKGIVFTNYQGLTHKQLETFKKAIKPMEAEYVAAKNSLLLIALAYFNKSSALHNAFRPGILLTTP